MLLSNEVSLTRKIKEVLLATRIEAAMPKDRILELYLNEIYLGSGAYGVAAAALTYFDKSLDELTLGEAAFLGGLPKAPNRYNPAAFPRCRQGAPRLGARPHGRGRLCHPRGGRRGPGTSRSCCVAAKRRKRSRRPISPRRCAASCSPAMAKRRFTAVGCRFAPASTRACRRRPTRRLRHGLIAYDHGHEGWRGAIAHIDPKGDWAAHLAAVPVPAVVSDVGWRLAVVLHTDARGAAIGFADGDTGHIPFAQMRWARPRYHGGSLGPFPRGAGDVVKPGDVVMVAPVAAEPV